MEELYDPSNPHIPAPAVLAQIRDDAVNFKKELRARIDQMFDAHTREIAAAANLLKAVETDPDNEALLSTFHDETHGLQAAHLVRVQEILAIVDHHCKFVLHMAPMLTNKAQAAGIGEDAERFRLNVRLGVLQLRAARAREVASQANLLKAIENASPYADQQEEVTNLQTEALERYNGLRTNLDLHCSFLKALK